MILVFGNCVLDSRRRQLYRDGELVHMRAKVFEILNYLIMKRDRVVSRDELLSCVWPDVTVSESTLNSSMHDVRKALGDGPGKSAMIQTLRGQGFRFIAEVATRDEAAPDTGGLATAPPSSEFHARDDGISIAVLPFANLVGDPSLDYLGDGLAEDIIAELSRFKAFTVIARSSSFFYRGPDNDITAIGAALAVDYVMMGSVRCANDVFRVVARLVHARSNGHIWTESYDGSLEDMLSLRNPITRSIVAVVKPEVDMAEIRKAATDHAGRSGALEMAWRARALLDRGRVESEPALYRQGMDLAEQAAAADPKCRQAWWTISIANFLLAFSRQGAESDRRLARARAAAERLRALDRNDHGAYMSLGWVNYIERDFARAATNLNHAHELNPNCTMTLMMLGVVEIASGEAERGDGHIRRAMRLSPRDLWLGFMIAARGFACFALARYRQGAAFMRRAIERDPVAPANHIILAACLAECNELEAAAAAIRIQRQVGEKLLAEYLAGDRLPFGDPELAARYAAALRRAAAAAG